MLASNHLAAFTPLPRSHLHRTFRCCVVTRDEIRRHPVWRLSLSSGRKDHRYYEILERTLGEGFDYRYFLISDHQGEPLAVQPFFLMDQDLLQGVPLLADLAKTIRAVLPGFLKVRTLMVGCVAGDGRLALSSRISSAEIGKLLAANLLQHADAMNARMIVMKDFSSEYRDALAPLATRGFARVPSLPAVSLDISHNSFDEFMLKALSANARRHLRKKLAASGRAGISMQVFSNPGTVLDDVYRLYVQVYDKSRFKFERLTPDYFRQVASMMGDKARFFTWWRNGQLIACSLSMIEGKTLCLEYLGLDYDVAFDLHLYHHTFRDQYNWAVENGYTRIWSGALGYDPKLHLKFQLEPLDLYIRHLNPVANAMLQHVLKLLVPARYDVVLKKFPNYRSLW
jgi:hypothetical protein